MTTAADAVPPAPATAAMPPDAAASGPEPTVTPQLDETALVPVATHVDIEAARLEILRSLERGELDVAAAADRLAALEAVGHEGV